MTVGKARNRVAEVEFIRYDGKNHREVGEFAGHAVVLNPDNLEVGVVGTGIELLASDVLVKFASGGFRVYTEQNFDKTYEVVERGNPRLGAEVEIVEIYPSDPSELPSIKPSRVRVNGVDVGLMPKDEPYAIEQRYNGELMITLKLLPRRIEFNAVEG